MAKAKAKKAKKNETASIIDPKYADRYKVSDTKTPSGRRAVDKDDKVARALRGKDQDELGKIAKKQGLGERWDKDWGKLNPGQRRMALGNAMRAQERAAA